MALTSVEATERFVRTLADVAIQNEQLFHALTRQRARHVGEHGELSARIHVDGKPKVELSRIHAKRYCRQSDHSSAFLPGELRRALGEGGRLVVVCAVREMKVVGLGRSPGKNCDLEGRVLDRLPVGFGEDKRA